MKNTIPIFIITRDRLDVLLKCINSLKQIDTPYEIIIHDNLSTYEPLINYLKKELLKNNLKVYWNKRNELNDVKYTINDYFQKGCESNYYIVTDPDIELLEIKNDILEFYMFLLETNLNIDVVGPMLEINDIPDFYPLKQKVIESHTRQFWHKKPYSIKFKNNNFEIQNAPIDTTFGMYRKNFSFHSWNHGIRTYKPYSAKHLDWYIDPKNLSPDQKYYLKSSTNVGHWSSSFLKPYVN